MRGPGDLEGTMQSGIAFDLKVANLSTDGQIVQIAHDWVDRVLDEDSELKAPQNTILVRQLDSLYSKVVDWSRIS
jgi:ATP-dependent DNA helicase RecG